jgi:hypothetical protein
VYDPPRACTTDGRVATPQTADARPGAPQTGDARPGTMP